MEQIIKLFASKGYLIFAGGFLAIMVLREILTWYWKVTKIVNLLEKIEENTRPRNIEKKVEVVNKGY